MKVLHVIPSVGPQRGGPSLAMDLMAAALTAAGVEVEVATTNDNDTDLLAVPFDTPVQRAGAAYRYFPRQARAYGVSLPLTRWLRSRVRDYDLVHAHALFSHTPIAAARIARSRAVPFVLRPLGTLADYGLRQHRLLKRISLTLLERPLLRDAAAIHCTSEAEAQEVRRLDPKLRTFVVPLGIEAGPLVRDRSWLRARAPRLDKRVVLLFLARIHPKKGLETLLEAMARAKFTGRPVGLIVAGTGPAGYLAALKELSFKHGVERDVEWVGHLEPAEKIQALQSADAFVLPSSGENFGIAVVEALAAGVPVIITREVGIAVEVERAQAGLVVPRDAHSIAGAINRLADDATRAAMAQRARQLARDRFSTAQMVKGLLEMYESVLRDVRSRH